MRADDEKQKQGQPKSQCVHRWIAIIEFNAKTRFQSFKNLQFQFACLHKEFPIALIENP